MTRTALVLIEYQNDFLSEGGALHEGLRSELARTRMLENTQHLVTQARQKGIKIIWVPIEFAPGYPELSAEPYGILAGVKATNAFQSGSWGAQIIDALRPQDDEIVIAGKRGLCGFASTNLDFILRQNGISRVAFGGLLTDCCVESSMRTAYELGYDVAGLTDCTATLSQAQHEAAIAHAFPMFSHPMTGQAFLQTSAD